MKKKKNYNAVYKMKVKKFLTNPRRKKPFLKIRRFIRSAGAIDKSLNKSLGARHRERFVTNDLRGNYTAGGISWKCDNNKHANCASLVCKCKCHTEAA